MIKLPDPVMRYPSRKHKDRWPSNMMCDARSGGVNRRQAEGFSIVGDYTAGQEGVLVTQCDGDMVAHRVVGSQAGWT
jgi:hypothetical protein